MNDSPRAFRVGKWTLLPDILELRRADEHRRLEPKVATRHRGPALFQPDSDIGRSHYWRIAHGSALETRSHLELLMLVQAVDDTKANKALELFDRVCAMTWRMLHPRG